MTTFDFPALAAKLLPAVLAAGAAQLRYYTVDIAVEMKADASPVTIADRESEALLLEGLWHAARGVPIVAEESIALGHRPPKEATYFLVDPLDGTREYVKRLGEFTVNIGLVVGNEPVFGMIYAPALGDLYVTLGEGRAVEAHIASDEPSPDMARCEFRELHTRAPDLSALTVLESRSHRTAATEAFLARYAISEVKRGGSSLKFCRIARGEADLYVRLGPTCEWDTAAGQAIVEAAGGAVTDLDGHRLGYGKHDATYENPSFVAWGRAPARS